MMDPQKADEESQPLNVPVKSSNPTTTRHPITQWTASQCRELLCCLTVFLVGLYLPKMFLFPTADMISSRSIPYTTLPSTGDVLLEARYNHLVADPPTVGSSFLLFTGVYLPIMVVIIVEFLRRKHPHAILSTLLMAIGLSEMMTQILKFWVRRPRPNYYHLCAFDIATKECKAPFSKIVEAQLSFPSGHTSLTFCSMTVLALWLFQMNITTTATSGNSSATGRNTFLVIASTTKNKLYLYLSTLIPWGWATFVGVSRIVDHWHHPSDVVAGCILGSACATLSFVIHFSTSDATSTVTTTTSSSSSSSSSCTSMTRTPLTSAIQSLSTKESLE